MRDESVLLVMLRLAATVGCLMRLRLMWLRLLTCLRLCSRRLIGMGCRGAVVG